MVNNNWYTQSEVAKLLNVSKASVYLYGKQGKIKRIHDPHRLHREARYEKESVDRFLEKRNKTLDSDDKKPTAIAKKLGINVQSIYRYIREGKVEAKKIPLGDEKMAYRLTDLGVRQLQEELKHKKSTKISIYRNDYYDLKLDIALYQKFKSDKYSDIRAFRRNNEWYFYINDIGEEISFEQGLQEKIEAAYQIHQKIMGYKGYAFIKIPKSNPICFPVIDYFYQTWGIENVRLREKDVDILIAVKAGAKPFNASFALTDLQPFVKEGAFIQDGNYLHVKSMYRKTSIELPYQILDKISELAKDEGLTMSQWLEKQLEKIL